ncbi:S41 family peptidase [Streptobacillus felis]|uniref:S41 family peptidase n=1 Tax=Streptobacillus felis TaxID=1384509 RepID=A0A7Z0PFP2_9FUSO|nr:S41 family peptidase [Streptobacillus felis]NYV27345.1 S41 family peptidase [Streptobacillus felis]
MKINKKHLLTVFLIGIFGYVTYSEENVTATKKDVPAVQRANATVDIKNINKIIQTINYINEIWVGSEEVDKEKLYEAALRGMVKSLKDPYSEYLSEKELNELNEGLDGVYVGVGMSIRKEKGDYMEVISPFIGGPAFKAGIQIGDIVTKIDDEDIIDLTATETSKMLRGDENTKVKIEIYRRGLKKPLTFTLTRATIKLDNVEYKMLDKTNKIGYISLLQFGSTVGEEIKESILDLEKQGMNKLILDLRTNPGGSLSEAVEIASMFVPDELIVSLKTKYGVDKKYNRVGEQIFKGDMVILVNKGSASASEIVTGVLKDYERATIIGETTYGKGVAQGIYHFKNEKDALKLTIAEYSTPKNKNINKNGIEPTIYIKMNSLLSDKGYSSETEQAKENRKNEIIKILEETEGKEKAAEIIKEGDRQLKAAIKHLLGEKVTPDKKEDDKSDKKTKKDIILEDNKDKK